MNQFTNCRNDRRREEERLTEAPVRIAGDVLQWIDALLARPEHFTDEPLQVIICAETRYRDTQN